MMNECQLRSSYISSVKHCGEEKISLEVSDTAIYTSSPGSGTSRYAAMRRLHGAPDWGAVEVWGVFWHGALLSGP